jgi:hypothetical protein
MEKESETTTHEFFYKILECCIINYKSSTADIGKHANIGERSIYIKQLENAHLIKNDGGYYCITPEGMSAFLIIQGQKQANKQARIATYIAIIAIGITLIINLILLLKK